MKTLALITTALALAGCSAAAGIDPSMISGKAAGVFGIPAAVCAAQISAEATSLQMLRAQLNGMPVSPPPLP